ncbi:hypothetical protein AS200_09430 [Streptomyces sp. CdTB01]|nr:hypothetical protein AS200_09430 [Streptomyces sp. CdTB01]
MPAEEQERRELARQIAAAGYRLADDSVPVLRQYLREVPITRPYFNVTPDSPIGSSRPRHTGTRSSSSSAPTEEEQGRR